MRKGYNTGFYPVVHKMFEIIISLVGILVTVISIIVTVISIRQNTADKKHQKSNRHDQG